jgi:molecular chaperone HscC
VLCRFTYDINGLLEVDLTVLKTGEKRQLVIIDKEAPMSEGELQRRREALARLKVHPRELEENRAMIARGERCYENALGDRRTIIGQQLSAFDAAIETQDPRTIAAAREQFAKVLDAFEGETFL